MELEPPRDELTATSSWFSGFRREGWAIAEALGFAPVTPDIDFVAFLRTLSRFGFFTFGPVTIDVRVVEDILFRTAERGHGGATHPPVSPDYIEFSNLLWEEVRAGGGRRIDELHYLLAFMKWGRGLPARVFGELGVSADEVARYARDRTSVGTAPHTAERLYSTEEAAAYYGVHIQTVRSWIHSGRLPAVRLAGLKAIRIRESDLRAVLEPIVAPGDPAPGESE